MCVANLYYYYYTFEWTFHEIYCYREEKPTQQDWEKLLKDILELQSTLFDCITKEQCHEV